MDINTDVLVERLEGVTKLITDKFVENEKSHNIILIQTTKTNGRVSELENLKNKVIGALIVMNIILLPIVYIILSNWISKRQ